MNSKLKSALGTLTLSAALLGATLSNASAAPLSSAVGIEGEGLAYATLYTESSWQSITIPISEVGGSLPSDLSLIPIPNNSVTLTELFRAERV